MVPHRPTFHVAAEITSYERDEPWHASPCDRGPVFLRRSPKFHRCPACGSDCVSRWSSEDVDWVRARVVATCGECGVARRLVVTIWAMEAFERRLDNQRRRIEVALARLERERLRGGVQQAHLTGADDGL